MVGSGVWGEVRKNDSRRVGTLPHPLEFLQELPTTKWTTDFSFTSLFSQKFLVLSIVHIARSGMTKERLNERTNSHPPPLFYALCLNRFLGKNSRTGCQLLGMPGSFFFVKGNYRWDCATDIFYLINSGKILKLTLLKAHKRLEMPLKNIIPSRQPPWSIKFNVLKVFRST